MANIIIFVVLAMILLLHNFPLFHRKGLFEIRVSGEFAEHLGKVYSINKIVEYMIYLFTANHETRHLFLGKLK